MTECVFDATYRQFLPFWDTLSEPHRELLCRSTAAVHYARGDLVHGGAECTGAILVKSGCLRAYLLSDEGREITLYRLRAGDVCMLSASCVLQSITFDVFVDALEESDCCLIRPEAFQTVSEEEQAMKIFGLETAVNRFSDVMWIMQQILFMSFDKRLAIFLLDESAKTGSSVLTLTQADIARYTGSAREVVSRMLKYFAAEGLVETGRGELRILDKKRLRALTE